MQWTTIMQRRVKELRKVYWRKSCTIHRWTLAKLNWIFWHLLLSTGFEQKRRLKIGCRLAPKYSGFLASQAPEGRHWSIISLKQTMEECFKHWGRQSQIHWLFTSSLILAPGSALRTTSLVSSDPFHLNSSKSVARQKTFSETDVAFGSNLPGQARSTNWWNRSQIPWSKKADRSACSLVV